MNLLELGADEKVSAVITMTGEEEDMYLFMATRGGMVKKTPLEQYKNIRKGGLNAVTLKENDELIEVRLTEGNDDVILVTKTVCPFAFRKATYVLWEEPHRVLSE